jgi:hypothetical protein
MIEHEPIATWKQLMDMSGHQQAHADPIEFEKDAGHVAGGFSVKMSGGLVCQQQVGSIDHRAGNRQSLLLAAGERDRVGLFALAQPDLVERCLCRGAALRAAGWPTIARAAARCRGRCGRTAA